MQPSAWFRIPRPNPSAKLRVFVFHHAGGACGIYAKWRNEMPQDTELVLAELPGRATRWREPLIGDFQTLLPILREQFLPELKLPSILIGHSLGAFLAYELCRSLAPSHLSMIRGLALSSFLPPTQENLASREMISDLPDEIFLQKLERYGPVPSVIFDDPALRSHYLGVIRSDIRLIESYRGETLRPLPIKSLVFGGSEDKTISSMALRNWRNLIEMQGEPRIFPGGHFYIFDEYKNVLRDLFLNFQG